MTTTALRNTSRTILVLNLPPDFAPKRAMYMRTVDHRNGSKELKEVRVVHGDSIHLLVGETRGGFSNAIRRCPEIIAAVARRQLELVEEPDAKSESANTVEDAGVDVVIDTDEPAPSSDAPVEENDTREAPASEATAPKSGGRNKGK